MPVTPSVPATSDVPAPLRTERSPRPSDPPTFPLPPAAPEEQLSDLIDHSIANATGTAEVPTWAFRSPSTTGLVSIPPGGFGPEGPPVVPPGGLTLDPMSLRRRVTIRSGPRALVVDDQHLILRSWWSKTTLTWPEIYGFELRVDDGPGGGGRLVAMTSGGPVELPATKRAVSDLRYVHALLDAYRARAQMVARG